MRDDKERMLLHKSARHDLIAESGYYEEYLDMTSDPAFFSQPEAIQEARKILWCAERGIDIFAPETNPPETLGTVEETERDTSIFKAILEEGFSFQTDKLQLWIQIVNRICEELPQKNYLTVRRFLNWVVQENINAQSAYKKDCVGAKAKGLPAPKELEYDLNISFATGNHISLSAEFGEYRANLFKSFD